MSTLASPTCCGAARSATSSPRARGSAWTACTARRRSGAATRAAAAPRETTRPGDDRTPARRFNADHDPDALVRGACDEALPGDGHLFAYWNTTGQLPEDALGRLRAHAAQRGTRLTIVVFNTLMHALSEPRARDLDALAAAVADSVAAVADAARGWAELAWLPAPRVCGPAPGWAIKHFGLPDYGGDELNARVARHNAVVSRRLARLAPAVLRVRAVAAMDPAGADGAAACACYDDYVHHHRITFNVISNVVDDLTAAGYCDGDVS